MDDNAKPETRPGRSGVAGGCGCGGECHADAYRPSSRRMDVASVAVGTCTSAHLQNKEFRGITGGGRGGVWRAFIGKGGQR